MRLYAMEWPSGEKSGSVAYTHRSPVHGTTVRVLPVSGFTTMTRLVLSSIFKRWKAILFPSGDHAAFRRRASPWGGG